MGYEEDGESDPSRLDRKLQYCQISTDDINYRQVSGHNYDLMFFVISSFF